MPAARKLHLSAVLILAFALGHGCEFHCSLGSGPVERTVVGPVVTEPAPNELPDGPEPVSVDDERFYVAWSDPDVEEGMSITARVIALQAQGTAPNTEMSRVENQVEANSHGGVFYWERPATGWPAGRYRVEVTRETTPIGAVEFDIEAAE